MLQQSKDINATIHTSQFHSQIISWNSLTIKQKLRKLPVLTEKLIAGFPTTEQQEQAGRERERSRAEPETADLMMNYMITCYASELFIQVEDHLQRRQRRRPSPFPRPPSLLSSSILPLLSSSLTPNTTTTITRTDVCCNPVAPFAVDTWRRHLDRNAAPLQIGERVRVFMCV